MTMAMLRTMGARIERTAPNVLEVVGETELSGVEHTVIGDRIEAGTFAVAVAASGGEVTISGFDPVHLGAFGEVLTGWAWSTSPSPATARPTSGPRNRRQLPAAGGRDGRLPGLATDLQAPLAVLMTQADGESTIHETIYSDRLEYTAELVKMGAEIEVADARHARGGSHPAPRPDGPDPRPAGRRHAGPRRARRRGDEHDLRRRARGPRVRGLRVQAAAPRARASGG